MSYDGEQMQNLKIAIREEIPKLKEQIYLSNLLKLVELSKGELDVLSLDEKREILIWIKDKYMTNSKKR